MDIGSIICGNWIIFLLVCIILVILVIFLSFGKSNEEKKLKDKIQNLTYEIDRLKKENSEFRKKKGESLKDEMRSIMVTSKSIKGEE